MWTGERRLLESESALRRASETDSRDDFFSFGGSGENFAGLSELEGRYEGRFDKGIDGGGRRTLPRGPGGKARILGLSVAKPARSRDPDGHEGRGRILNGGIFVVMLKSSREGRISLAERALPLDGLRSKSKECVSYYTI